MNIRKMVFMAVSLVLVLAVFAGCATGAGQAERERLEQERQAEARRQAEAERTFSWERVGNGIRITGIAPRVQRPRPLVIPSHIQGLPVTEIGERAFSFEQGAGGGANTAHAVIIPDTVTHIRSQAFRVVPVSGAGVRGPGQITELTLGSNVTYIGAGAFVNNAIQSVSIPDSVTHIGNGAFSMFPDISQVTMRNPDNLAYFGNNVFGSAETAIARGLPMLSRQRQSFEQQADMIQQAFADARIQIPSRANRSGAAEQIQWRNEWLTTIERANEFFRDYVSNRPPFTITYSADIRQGAINFQNNTVELSGFRVTAAAGANWGSTATGVLRAVSQELQATGQASIWGIVWPTQRSGNTVSMSPSFAPGLGNVSGSARNLFPAYNVQLELLNSEGRVIGSAVRRIHLGWQASASGGFSVGAMVSSMLSTPADLIMTVNANDITPNMTVRIASINGVSAAQFAAQRGITIVNARS